MKKKSNSDRRAFIKSMGVLGLAGAAAPIAQSCSSSEKRSRSVGEITVPTRPLGNTGIEVPAIAVGLGSMDRFFKEAYLKYALTYWDTSIGYGGGKTESALGEYFANNPDIRKKVFMVTKSDDCHRHMNEGLERFENEFNTSYQRFGQVALDGYVVLHAVQQSESFLPGLGDWVKKKKDEGKFRFAGISTHANMAEALKKASQEDWIDFVYLRYNFSVMNDEKLNEAIDACYDAGKGIVAIKTQRNMSFQAEVTLDGPYETDAMEHMVTHFREEGYTDGQVKLKMVLDDKRFSSAAVSMHDIGLVAQNVAAAMDRTKLSSTDMEVLQKYADATKHLSCQGCSSICEKAMPEMPYIADVMRYLVYYNGHCEHSMAMEEFKQLPNHIKRNLKDFDYTKAEKVCPNKMAIGKMMHEAHHLLFNKL